jgi:hypothetical protein
VVPTFIVPLLPCCGFECCSSGRRWHYHAAILCLLWMMICWIHSSIGNIHTTSTILRMLWMMIFWIHSSIVNIHTTFVPYSVYIVCSQRGLYCINVHRRYCRIVYPLYIQPWISNIRLCYSLLSISNGYLAEPLWPSQWTPNFFLRWNHLYPLK